MLFLLELLGSASCFNFSEGVTVKNFIHAGVCYLCCANIPVPKTEDVTLSDFICDGCKKAGFWSQPSKDRETEDE